MGVAVLLGLMAVSAALLVLRAMVRGAIAIAAGLLAPPEAPPARARWRRDGDLGPARRLRP